MAAKKLTVKFGHIDRETQNKRRYQESVDEGKDPVIDKLYLSKAKLKELGDPDSLTVTIEPGV